MLILSLVADNWGVSMYAIYLFVLTIYWSIHWGDASACPYTHLEDVFLGNKSLRIALLLIWAELIGGLAIFRYIQVLWSLEIVSTHKNRAFEECTTDLQASQLFLILRVVSIQVDSIFNINIYISQIIN